MWVFTLDGFYSAVNDLDHPGYLLVRTRSKDDATRLVEWCQARKWPTSLRETPDADYGWRLSIHRSLFGFYLMESVGNIDYPNFKEEVGKQLGQERADIYSDVWYTLLVQLQGIAHR